jgi:hypothetical protein
MKRSFNRTLTKADLSKETFKLLIFDKTKYEQVEVDNEVEYTGVTSWDIIEGGDEAAEIESLTDASGVDENHEYLVLHFEDGSEGTFRNSHVEMFII